MLEKYCSDSNLSWRSKYYDAFTYTDKQEIKHTILRYQIPYPKLREQELFLKYPTLEQDKTFYYQRLAHAVQNQFNASRYLSKQEISSILTFDQVEKTQKDCVTTIFFSTPPIRPIRHLLKDETDTLQAVTILMRLATILRDLNQLEPPVSLRGFDIDEIYVTDDDRYLLGGLYYTVWDDSSQAPIYLPERPNNLPRTHQMGRIGESYDDVYTLAALAWSIFAGCPIGSELPPLLVYPMYAPEEVAQAITIGLSGEPDALVQFRKRLVQCRKKLVTGEIENKTFPLIDKYKSTFVEDINTYCDVTHSEKGDN